MLQEAVSELPVVMLELQAAASCCLHADPLEPPWSRCRRRLALGKCVSLALHSRLIARLKGLGFRVYAFHLAAVRGCPALASAELH